MSSPQLTLYLAESGLNWLKLVVLMEEVRDLISYLCLLLSFRSLVFLISEIPGDRVQVFSNNRPQRGDPRFRQGGAQDRGISQAQPQWTHSHTR